MSDTLPAARKLDGALAGVLASIEAAAPGALVAAGMTRVRGGMAGDGHTVAWAEVAGRGADGAWYELRLHHRPTEQRLQAGLLAYQPLARGGHTVPIGTANHGYRTDTKYATAMVAAAVVGWLRGLSEVAP